MKRTILMVACSVLLASPVFAIDEFRKQWRDYYLTEDRPHDFVRIGRAAGCYVCHIKGEKKSDVRNEYGKALSLYLDADDFPKEWVEANPDEAKRKIIAAFKKVEEDLSKDKRKFGDKLRNSELPAIDAGL